MGGPIGLSEVDVVLVEQPSTVMRKGTSGDGLEQAREAVIRFPAGATHAILTALPLSPSSYRIEVLKDAGDLSRLAGTSGRGKKGYAGWLRELKEQGMTADAMVQG
ncbi:hypothetical protein Rhopal_006917-T1 [Rhodotorula paludigena]|uniref:Uncharacterized protein n=1 Tax=Rhodotorula paludigena TaxID=86838 RepID=A0AAV5GUF9_9BASI|nr:hypothetical protein Rhopal_006917-T1 [Rhodotorula paludigena]